MATTPRRRVVLDTDTFNEVDDQFALAQLLLSPDKVNLEAVYAAPFYIKGRCANPADGMKKSFEEIHRVLDLLPVKNPPAVFPGSTGYLPSPRKPVESEAALDIVERALATPRGERLLVLGIAVATNIASALLIEPKIASKIEIVWLGGHAPGYWPDANEFNLSQDIHAARTLLESPAPLTLIPCCPVASHLTVTIPELENELAPYSNLGAYLTKIVSTYGKKYGPGWSKPIWDISASSYAINPEWLVSYSSPAPVLKNNLTWASGTGRRKIRIVQHIQRNAIFGDLYARMKKLGKAAKT